MADTVSGIFIRQIGAVLNMPDFIFCQILCNLFPAQAQDRPDDLPGNRAHRTKPPQPGSTTEIVKHGLRQILLIMRQSYLYRRALHLCNFFLKGFFPHQPSGFLLAQFPLPAQSRHIIIIYCTWNFPFPAYLFHKGTVPVCFLSTDSMMYMDDSQSDPKFLLKLLQNPEHRHGIASPGYPCQDSISLFYHLVLPYISQNFFFHLFRFFLLPFIICCYL